MDKPLVAGWLCFVASMVAMGWFADDAHAQKTIEIGADRAPGTSSTDASTPSGDDTSDSASDKQSDDGAADNSDGEGNTGSKIQIQRGSGSAQNFGGGQLTLEFDRMGGSILVRAKVNGEPAYFRFDTGASITTLTPNFARQVGAFPRGETVERRHITAGGARMAKYGIMRELVLAGRPHNAVSYSLCKPCGGKSVDGVPVVGLLGMNVLGRYDLQIDDAAGVVRMTTGSNFSNRRDDIAPWLSLEAKPPDNEETDDIRAVLEVTNHAPRAVRFYLAIDCRFGDGTKGVVRSDEIDIAADSTRTVRVPTDNRLCGPTDIKLESANW